MHPRIAIVLCSILLSGITLAAEDSPHLGPRTVAQDEEIITAWDGTPENGLGWEPNVMVGEYVQRFDGLSGQLTRIEVCWFTDRQAPLEEAMFSVILYEVGSGGNPGEPIFQSEETTLTAPVAPAFNCVRIATGGMRLDQDVFAGGRWRPTQSSDLFVPLDRTSPQQVLRGRSQIGGVVGDWGNVNDFAPEARAFAFSLFFVPDGSASTGCTSGPTALCLNDNRFRVELDWRRRNEERGQGQVVQDVFSEDSGLFYFFDPDNWEMLVKVLNACGDPFNHYWVFFAATTNVEFTMTVTDTQRAEVKNYFNPLNTAAPPIQDTSAFATCP